MPDARLRRTRGTLPEGYRFGDARLAGDKRGQSLVLPLQTLIINGTVHYLTNVQDGSQMYVQMAEPHRSRMHQAWCGDLAPCACAECRNALHATFPRSFAEPEAAQ